MRVCADDKVIDVSEYAGGMQAYGCTYDEGCDAFKKFAVVTSRVRVIAVALGQERQAGGVTRLSQVQGVVAGVLPLPGQDGQGKLAVRPDGRHHGRGAVTDRVLTTSQHHHTLDRVHCIDNCVVAMNQVMISADDKVVDVNEYTDGMVAHGYTDHQARDAFPLIAFVC